MAGRFLVIAGGITRNASPNTHVLMVDMQELKFVTYAPILGSDGVCTVHLTGS